MTDLPYVLAAYGVVIATLGGYAFHLRRRLDRARRRRALIDRTARVAGAARADVPTPDRP
ncbi:MAG: CcmD family protein [Candidatus Limnocylindrales bacterium]